jgi:hypothetical protein
VLDRISCVYVHIFIRTSVNGMDVFILTIRLALIHPFRIHINLTSVYFIQARTHVLILDNKSIDWHYMHLCIFDDSIFDI